MNAICSLIFIIRGNSGDAADVAKNPPFLENGLNGSIS